jgi:cobalt/nickel transport system permease protein
MHIPDGFLSLPTSASLIGVSGASLGLSVWKTTKELAEKQVPLLAVTAAFIFAAQMLNFPVAVGTSGHFLGAVLAAILLGPYASFIVMTIVLLLQALIFKDGGLLALGANVFNMAFVGGLVGGWLFIGIKKILPKTKSAFLALTGVIAWLSVVLASFACSVELSVSGTFEFLPVTASMLGVHVIIGLGEAIITVIVVSIVLNVRPDLVALWQEGK